FGNANYLDCGHYTGWYWNQSVDIPWSKRLLVGSFTGSAGLTGDPDYCQKVADRWGVLRTNVLSSSRLLARIDELVAQLYEGATRPVMGDFTKRFGHVTSSGNNAGAEDFARLGIYQW